MWGFSLVDIDEIPMSDMYAILSTPPFQNV